MKTLIKTTLLLLAVLLLSCEKDPVFTPLTDGTLLKEVYIGDNLFYAYTYNDAKQIAEQKNKWSYTKYNYGNNRLVSCDLYFDNRIFSSSSYVVEEAQKRTEWVNPQNTEKEATLEYFYEGDKLIKSTMLYGYSTYGYDDNNRIARQTFHEPDGRESGYIDFFYDSKGNMVKRLHYSVSSEGEKMLDTTTIYEFDDKNNPYRAFSSLMLPGENTNPNNIIKETYTIHFEVDNFIEKVQVKENHYEYNGKGYPVSMNNKIKFTYH